MSPYHASISKRFLDISFSLLILPFIWPFLIISLVLVWLSSGGQVFFYQTRVGRFGASFKLIKIRTLHKRFDSAPGALHGPNDITLVGKFLRKTHIDELPQIWNILKGDMSWVGPRPEVPYFYEHFKELEPTYADRQLARPGITGLAQLNNPDASPNENLEKLKFDLDYVNQATFWMDVRILVQTFLLIWK